MSPRAAARIVLLAGALSLGAAWTTPARAETWCGATPAAVDKVPDAVGGNQFHVVYAIPADGVDHFAERVSGIASDLALVDRWWRLQDSIRAPRFDLLDVGCASTFGRLDVSSVRLPQPASSFVPLENRFGQVLNGVAAAVPQLGKKSLVYFDSPVALDGDVCGQAGARAPLTGGLQGSAALYIAPNLWGVPGCGTIGGGDWSALIAAHELTHSLGALPPGAPHACPTDDGHPCDNETDILFSGGGPCCLFARQLDYGHDDYYAHGGSWWDTQDSPWLAHLDRPQSQLTVRIAGDAGESLVESDLPGISCPPGCSVTFDSDATVRLSATAAEGDEFVGFQGDCTGAGCSLSLGQARSVTVVFGPARFPLEVKVRGKGRVTSVPAGVIACPRKCSARPVLGARVELSARPAANSRFVGWRGGCTGRKRCTVTDETYVTAVFGRRR